jgi:hypothetical protein
VSDTENPRADELVQSLRPAFSQILDDAPRGLDDVVARLGFRLQIPRQEMAQLVDLGFAVVHERDVGQVRKATERIRARQDASDLALFIATTMQGVDFSSGKAAKAARERMLGALFGAFVGLRNAEGLDGPRRTREAVVGAMGGVLAFTAYQTLGDRF